ncbi:MAG: tRNA (guanosine(37)-N1)-methyltransferase TrmD [Bacteroidales bacterium]|jgi:tRNA (guanine37-N1)-methyltransferase|nr:tRNA (guanosine(37)-N1)-methyltransferase TrmD [Bacteroidales bacterium]
MRIDIITLFPEMFGGFLEHSIVKRAQQKGFVQIALHQLRDYSADKHRSIDDDPYGGGAGMVMNIEPIIRCIESLQSEKKADEIIFLTPDAPVLTQKTANELSLYEHIILLCGHYKGVDERVREHFITREISIGDYVLSGGELAAAVLTDTIVRVIPGVLHDETSALTDSFQNEGLLSPPVYTRPADYNGWKVPPVLLSGNDKLIAEWRQEQALKRTQEKRPDLLTA